MMMCCRYISRINKKIMESRCRLTKMVIPYWTIHAFGKIIC